MKAKDLILIALICVNATLAAVVVTSWLAQAEPRAVAFSETRAGDYIMVSGPITTSREALLVIDVVAKRANLYIPQAATTKTGTAWELTSSRNLAVDFAAGAGAGAGR